MRVILFEPPDPKPATKRLIAEIAVNFERTKDDVDLTIVFKDPEDNEYLFDVVPSPVGTLAIKITSKIRNEDKD